jgi:GH35 family endo-1,4-beta-xylanase
LRKDRRSLISPFVSLMITIVLFIGSYMDSMAKNMVSTTDTLDYEDSPFGIQDLQEYDPRMAVLGISWARLSGASGLVWDANEPQPGRYDFRKIDKIIHGFSEHGIHLLVTILCFNKMDQDPKTGVTGPFKYGLPNNLTAYRNYLKTAVSRYPQVEYYQIENEPTNAWSGTAGDFADLVKVSALAIKEANPKAKIVLAGAATPESLVKFYEPMLHALNGLKDSSDKAYFDVVDLHWSGQFEYKDTSQGNYRTETFPSVVYEYKAVINEFRRILADSKFKNVPIWVTEMSDYSDKPIEPNYLYQSEKQHAIEVLKRYVYSLAMGVEKIFWVGITELHNGGNFGINNYWDHTGLVNNPENDGQSHKKLAYYTCKKTVEILSESGWDRIDIIQESESVCIFKLSGYGRPIYVAWNDSKIETPVSLKLGRKIKNAKITKAVPRYTSGKEIMDYDTAFETRIDNVHNGKIRLVLDDMPIFIEEQ